MKLTRKPIAILLIVIILVITGAINIIKSKKTKPKEVNIEKAIKRELSESTTATGNIEANYRNNISLNSSQKVLKIFVQEGQLVKKGDLLLLMDTSEYENQLEKAQINLENAKLVLNQSLATGNAADKSTSENSVYQAQYALENAQRKYEDSSKKYNQNKALFESGAISQSQLDEAKKNAEDDETTLKSAQAALVNTKNSAKDISSSSENKIANQRNQIELIQKDIENYKKKINDSNIISNIDGKVIKIAAKETGLVVTVEDQSINGGLGGAVAEVIAESGINCRFKRIGLPDEFCVIGSDTEIYKYYHLDSHGIAVTVKEML